MRKVFYVMVTVFVAVCLFGISSSLAGDSEEVDGVARVDTTAPAPAAIADQNYFIEIWVSDSTSSTSKGVRVFSSGSTVRCHVKYYIATAGEITRYYMVANAAGSIQNLEMFTQTGMSVGEHTTYLNVSGLAAGVYFFTSVITAQGNHMVSPSHCWFIVE